MGTHNSNERRRSYRVPIDGTAFLWRRQQLAGHYAVGDISIGGCLLQHGPPCDMHHEYRLVLHMDEQRALRLPARVVRLRYGVSGCCDLGMSFTEHPPATEDSIHDLVMYRLEHPTAYEGRVLVVHSDPVYRERLCDAIRSMGYHVVGAGTPLEAVWELENGPMDFHTAFVARALGPSDGSEIVAYISTHYPSMRRILVDSVKRPKPKNAHAVLQNPLSPYRLRKVMPAPSPSGNLLASHG